MKGKLINFRQQKVRRKDISRKTNIYKLYSHKKIKLKIVSRFKKKEKSEILFECIFVLILIYCNEIFFGWEVSSVRCYKFIANFFSGKRDFWICVFGKTHYGWRTKLKPDAIKKIEDFRRRNQMTWTVLKTFLFIDLNLAVFWWNFTKICQFLRSICFFTWDKDPRDQHIQYSRSEKSVSPLRYAKNIKMSLFRLR